MGRVPSRFHSVAVASVTGPLVIPGIPHHSCFHRIQFNIPLALQEVALPIHEAGLEAPLPEGAGALIFVIKVLSVTLAEGLHEHGQRLIRLRRHQKMGVIAHQNPGMNGYLVLLLVAGEKRQIGSPIWKILKTNLPVITPLNYMLGHPGRTNPWSARHLTFLVK
jgi:hypothetical protein